MQSYFNTNPESFVESPEDMISKVGRQEPIVDKIKKILGTLDYYNNP